jgi:hypothetical protein
LTCERVQTGQHMFNRHARPLEPAVSHAALPLRAEVMTAFRARVKTLPLPPRTLSNLLASLEDGLNAVSEGGGRKSDGGGRKSDGGGRKIAPEACGSELGANIVASNVLFQLAEAPTACMEQSIAENSGACWHAFSDLRKALFHASGREPEGQTLWREAVATAAFASQLATASGASVAVAACGGLFHRAGEAFALRCLALAESEHGVRIDAPSKSQLCSQHGRDLAERLVREWNLPSGVGACVVGWRRFGEFSSVSPEASAVYFGHMLAGELLRPHYAANGALDAAVSQLGIAPTAADRVRARTHEVRELLGTLG